MLKFFPFLILYEILRTENVLYVILSLSLLLQLPSSKYVQYLLHLNILIILSLYSNSLCWKCYQWEEIKINVFLVQIVNIFASKVKFLHLHSGTVLPHFTIVASKNCQKIQTSKCTKMKQSLFLSEEKKFDENNITERRVLWIRTLCDF